VGFLEATSSRRATAKAEEALYFCSSVFAAAFFAASGEDLAGAFFTAVAVVFAEVAEFFLGATFFVLPSVLFELQQYAPSLPRS
jgi:hypothetical protein